jgi:DNA-binding NtrC family response regulator
MSTNMLSTVGQRSSVRRNPQPRFRSSGLEPQGVPYEPVCGGTSETVGELYSSVTAGSEQDQEASLRATPFLERIPTLDEVEREHVGRVLCACGGNITMAAAILGRHRITIQRKRRS